MFWVKPGDADILTKEKDGCVSVGNSHMKLLCIVFKARVIVDVVTHLHGSREQYKDAPLPRDMCHMTSP